jgi:hypothetical protein
MGKVKVGSKIRPGDVADLMEWIEKKVGKRSKEPMDVVWLPLVVAELAILLAREHWGYDEPVDESIAGIRLSARELAKVMYDGMKADV